MLAYLQTHSENGGALKVVKISSADDLEEWLQDKPKEWGQLISCRVFLRILPLLSGATQEPSYVDDLKNKLVLAALRASLTTSLTVKQRSASNMYAAKNAALAVEVIDDAIKSNDKYKNDNPLESDPVSVLHFYTNRNIHLSRVVLATASAAISSTSAPNTFFASKSSALAFRAILAAKVDDIALEKDLKWLLVNKKERNKPHLLLTLPLWQCSQNPLERNWQSLKKYLISLDPNWQFWIDWYQAKLDGTLHPSLTQAQQNKLYYQIATFPNELWEEGAEAINQRIAELMEEVKEGEGNDFEEETDEPYELELPPQNKAALTFKTNEDGQAQLAPASENEQVLSDEGAKARHEETLYSGEELIRLFDPNKSGANAVARLIEKTQRCLDALGKTPQEVDIDRLIPRGEALRQIANREENRDDFTDVPPLPDGFKEALNNFLAAYNPYIALDPVLEKRDQIRLGPDEKGQLITTVEGQVIIDALTEANLLEEDTKDILDEVTNTAEGSTDPESRANRYYSESLRNLGRNILTEVDKAYKSIKNKGKIASEVCFDAVVVGAALIHQDFARKRAQIILKHEKWFVKNFGRTLWMKKMMVGFIHRIKTNPLLTDDDN